MILDSLIILLALVASLVIEASIEIFILFRRLKNLLLSFLE